MKNSKYENKIFTIPNCISMARIIASIGLFAYIGMYGITSPLGVTMAAAVIGGTDAVDGYVARRFNMISKFGKILDPIADKVFNWGIGFTLMASGIMPLWPLAIGVRDIAVAGVSAYQLKKNEKLMTPTMPAKAKMLFQSVGVAATLAFGFGTSGLSLIAPIAMGTAVATAIPEIFCIKKKYFSAKEVTKKEEPNIPPVRNNIEEEAPTFEKCNTYDSGYTMEEQLDNSKSIPRQKIKSMYKKN